MKTPGPRRRPKTPRPTLRSAPLRSSASYSGRRGLRLPCWSGRRSSTVGSTGPDSFNWPWRGVGAVAVLGGLVLTLWTLRLFDDADTTHHPYGRPAAFIRSGPYRFSRNPMYLGVTIFVLGVGVLVGTPALMFCWLAFAWIIHVRFIPREERALEKQFGGEYEEYRSQVRRWL